MAEAGRHRLLRVPCSADKLSRSAEQSLLRFVGERGWSDERVLAKVCDMVLPAIERAEPVEAWIIDDAGQCQVQAREGQRSFRR
jgi:SRSO17 transposase